jgi:hypothetical protein
MRPTTMIKLYSLTPLLKLNEMQIATAQNRVGHPCQQKISGICTKDVRDGFGLLFIVFPITS